MADILNQPIVTTRDKDIEPVFISDNVLAFIKHSDFGPLYDKDGIIIRDKIQDILIFLDEDGGMYQISNRIIVITLLRTYIEHNDLYFNFDPNSINQSYIPDDTMTQYFPELREYRTSHKMSGLRILYTSNKGPELNQRMLPENLQQMTLYLNTNKHLSPLDRAYKIVGLKQKQDEDEKIDELHRINIPLFIRSVNDEIEKRLLENFSYLKKLRIDRSRSMIKSARR